jgi:hypothetical protein
MDTIMQPFPDRMRLRTLIEIYLEFRVPLQVAYRAAEADLCQLDALSRKISSTAADEIFELSTPN